MSITPSPIRALTTTEMIEDYHIELIQMMENADHSLAKLARRMLGGLVYLIRFLQPLT